MNRALSRRSGVGFIVSYSAEQWAAAELAAISPSHVVAVCPAARQQSQAFGRRRLRYPLPVGISREGTMANTDATSFPDAIAEEMEKLQGTWKQIAYERDGIRKRRRVRSEEHTSELQSR